MVENAFCFVFTGFEQNLLRRETLGIFVQRATSQRNFVQDKSVVSGLKCLEKSRFYQSFKAKE